MRATDGTWRTMFPDTGSTRWPVSALLVASAVLVLTVGAFLCGRRMVGAMTGPLSAPQLFATAGCLLAWTFVVRSLSDRWRVLFWLNLTALLLFAIGCSFPLGRLVDWIAWLPAFALVLWPYSMIRTKFGAPLRICQPPREEISDSEQVIQQLNRVRMADGRDALRGTLIAEFRSGERQTTLYIGFCPPFELLPDVEASVVSELEAEVKLAQVLHNGAQIDVRLTEPAEDPLAVTIELFAIEGS